MGLDFWRNSGFAGEYNVVISVPQSVIGCYGLVQVQELDGHLAGVVYPQNLNAFNAAKSFVWMFKSGK